MSFSRTATPPAPPPPPSDDIWEDDDAGAGTHFVFAPQDTRALPLWPLSRYLAIENQEEPVRTVTSADELLQWGIDEYTFVPGQRGVLGQGRFAVVYKVASKEGKEHALKHIPLHPHHPLIASRLLREPTLLAELPRHPCLIGMIGWIRTPEHFYLLEAFEARSRPLSEIGAPISAAFAWNVLDQLVSVVRDCLHRSNVAHRDIKPDNILIDDRGHVVILDLGLATRFSPLEPKLTTCAGSPAFHAPEIVDALNHPPGVIRYVGPEVDVWCVGLVVLYLLTGDRHPIGSEHRNLDVMQASVQRQLKRVEDELLRETLASFLDLDGDARMEAFRSHIIDPAVAADIKRRSADLKPISTDEVEDRAISFVAREPRCRLDPVEGGLSDLRVLRFHLDDTPRETLADVKHMLRSAGILYHVLTAPDNPVSLLQCVLTLSSDSPYIPRRLASGPSFLSTLLGDPRRSSSVPANSKRVKNRHCIRFWLVVSFLADGESADVVPCAGIAQLAESSRSSRSRPSLVRSHTARPPAPSTKFAGLRERSRSRKRSPLAPESPNDVSLPDLEPRFTIRVSDPRCMSAVRRALVGEEVVRGRPAERRPSDVSELKTPTTLAAEVESIDLRAIRERERRPPRIASPDTAGWFATRHDLVERDRSPSLSPGRLKGLLLLRE